ncbi:DUF4810 domain-containing protein [Dryocola sp. BD613]|uniref:DUF4810 domain-containing protein n=1 Tax=Dryocola sp. BD613 TaxID=3133272 RepID=UPI003F4FCF00
MKNINKIGLWLIVIVLTGCAKQEPKKIYYWGNYQDTLYSFYANDSSSEAQIGALQAIVEKAKATAKPVPPGLHAQLGMLYSNTGKMDLAIAEFNKERMLFPESTPYIDFLTSKDKGSLK